MKKIILYSLLCFAFNNSTAQDLEFGLLTGGSLYQQIKWERAYYKPPNAYHTYIENNLAGGLVNKNSVLNGVHFGISTQLKYKRFAGTVEPQYFYQRTQLNFDRPFFVQRIIGKRAFRMPIYVSYKVFKNPKSPFLLAGLNLIKEKNWDFSAPGFDAYFGSEENYLFQIDLGDDHFEGMLYDNHWYWNYMLGFGMILENWNYSLRFQQRLDITKHKVEASIFQVEMVVNVKLFSSKDFTKKHFLYVD